MDPRLCEIIDSLASDMSSGASEMLSSVLNSLLAIPDDELASIPVSEWEEFAIRVHKAKPSIAPLFNVANAIMLQVEHGSHGSCLIRDTLMEMLDRERRSSTRIAELATKMVKGEWLVTTSYSSTVGQVLKTLHRSRPLRVTVAEASPGGEGRLFAKKLSELGMECEVIHDSTLFARMAEADGAITGADSLTPTGLVNKVGTRVLVEAARAHELPAHAVCGWSKTCPVVLSDLIVSRKELGPRLSEHVQVFESSPLELFTTILTDQGPLSPSDLRMELGVRKIARGWYSRGVLTKPQA